MPWIYRRLEEEGVPAGRMAERARRRELELIEPLMAGDEAGVFGRAAGEGVKRLPSDAYWGGLRSWGIRRFDATREEYHRAVDEIYRRRRMARHAADEGVEERLGTVTWHPELPPAPPDLHENATFALGLEEAEFLRDRIGAEHPSALLAWLAFRPKRTAVRYPWEHPRAPEMEDEHLEILHHARLFSEVMYGAPILYNLMLSEELGHADWVDDHRRRFTDWLAELDREAIARWDLPGLFDTARAQRRYRVTPPTEDFVRRWVALVRDDPGGIPERADARALVRRREILLKGARSLFRNRRALEERYGGSLGLVRLDFRWSNVQVLLKDLHDVLEGG